MKKVRQLNKWGIYELSPRERKMHRFNFAVIHPDVMGCGNVTASDTDIEVDSLEEAVLWVECYGD